MKRQYQVLFAAVLAIVCLALISRLLQNRSDGVLSYVKPAKPSPAQSPVRAETQAPSPKPSPAISLTSFPPAVSPRSQPAAKSQAPQPDTGQSTSPVEPVQAVARPRGVRIGNSRKPNSVLANPTTTQPVVPSQNIPNQNVPDQTASNQDAVNQNPNHFGATENAQSASSAPPQAEVAPNRSAADDATPVSIVRADTTPPAPTTAPATPASSAVLKGAGDVVVNGTPLGTSAVFPGDHIETGPSSIANINEPGSSVVVQPNSSVTYTDGSVQLKHGGVAVTTDQGAAVEADGATISPLAKDRTTFEVNDSDDRLYIAARTGAVAINDGSEGTVLQEGQETTRPKSRREHAGAAVPGSSTSLKPALEAAAVAGAITAIVLALPDREPLSPSKP